MQIRDDLLELLARRALTEDDARPDAVARRHATGRRTARDKIADLIDEGSFVEYGRLITAAQEGASRPRRTARPDRGRRTGGRPGQDR